MQPHTTSTPLLESSHRFPSRFKYFTKNLTCLSVYCSCSKIICFVICWQQHEDKYNIRCLLTTSFFFGKAWDKLGHCHHGRTVRLAQNLFVPTGECIAQEQANALVTHPENVKTEDRQKKILRPVFWESTKSPEPKGGTDIPIQIAHRGNKLPIFI